MSNVLKLPLSEPQARQILRDTASNSARLIITHHAQERMSQRNISLQDVLTVLKKGRITEGPALDPKGSWKLTIEGISAGSHVAVVAAIDYKELEESSCYTIVITAYD